MSKCIQMFKHVSVNYAIKTAAFNRFKKSSRTPNSSRGLADICRYMPQI